MDSNSQLMKIWDVLSPADATRVVTALRQDGLVWAALTRDNLLQKAVDLPFAAAENWTPARLALLSAGLHNLADGLASGLQVELPADILQEALHACDMLLTAGQFPGERSELESALLCAFALRDRYRLTRSWSDVLREPCAQAAGAAPSVHARWRAVLACLPGVVPEPLSLLHAIAALPEPIGRDWACHCVLSVPLVEEDRQETLLALLRERTTAQQIRWCRHLRAAGHAELAQTLAAELTAAAADLFEEAQPDPGDDLESLSRHIAILAQRAALHHLAADEDAVRPLLERAQHSLLHAYAGIQVQLAGFSAGEPEWSDLSTRELVRQAAETPLVAHNLLLGAGSRADSSVLADLLPEHNQPALSLLYRAQLSAAEGDLETAQELARQSVPLFLQDCSAKVLPYADAVFAWEPTIVLQKLEALGLLTEACQLAEAALARRPADHSLIRQAVKLYQSAGDSAGALQWARLGVVLAPDDLSSRRTCAGLCEAVAAWADGLRAWEAVLALQENPPAADRLGLARCAYHCGLFERSLQVCREVLTQDPDDGLAEALVGQIALRNGQRDEAVRHLSRATLLAPDEPQPWLSLAGIYRANGDTQREVETLHAAVLSVPESGDLHFALARSCLDMEMPSEALPHLQEAARLNPGSPEVAWKLGKTLNHLGHARQARRVLESARAHWPSHPQVALADAETLMEAGEMEAAIVPLEVAVNSEAPESGWFLLYAKALLGFTPDRMLDASAVETARLDRAAQALETVLLASPHHFEAGVLLAETLQAQCKPQESFVLYSGLVEDPRAGLPEWRWRVQAGFGHVALANREVETAVAALREATQAQPENIALHQMLTLAYRGANLIEEAVQSARQTLQLDSQDLSNLTWYIDTMKALGKVSDTIDALEAVTRLVPERAGFWNLLAQVQAEKGNAFAAKSALGSLLQLEKLTATDYEHAAETFTLMGESTSALACLDKAVQAAQPAPAALLFEVAALRQQLQQPEAALEAVQAAAAQRPESLALHVFQADLLAELNQLQPALDCLERALRLLESQADGAVETDPLRQGNLPDAWWRSLRDPASIYTRFALLLRAAGTLGAALNHAEKALELNPASLPLHYLAAELARGMLNYAKAEGFADLSGLALAGGEEDAPWLDALTVLSAEMALDHGQDTEAQHAGTALSPDPENSRSLALNARLLQRAGNWSEANDAYAAALRSVRSSAGGSLRQIEWDDVFAGGSRLALAEAALDLEYWGEALREMDAYTAEHPQEARAHLRRARALVLCAERQHLCAVLRSTTHAPGADALSGAAFERFERAIQAAARLANTVEVSTWQARGRAAFQPGLQHAPAVAKLPNPGEHAPALLAVLRLANNAENAIRIMPHYPQSPVLQLELALCYYGQDNLKGLQAARSAASAQPDRPLHHAAHALLAHAAGETREALLAVQTALTQWPDEPWWQAWAAELCRQTGDDRGAVAHYEQCLALDPTNIDTALALGRLYLSNGQAGSAVTMLERACLATPDHVEALLLLAQARRMTGDLPAALDNAQTAARLAPDLVAPKLMCGEIALQLGKPGVALEHARAALMLDPGDADAVLFLSRVYVQTGALSDGLVVLEKALPSLGNVQPVLLERANLIHRLYGPQVALAVFMELGQLFPQDANILSLLAQTQADCGDTKGAEQSAFAAYHLNPNLPQLNVLLGRLQRAAGQLDQSIHFFSEAIRQSPADVEPYLDLGEAYLDRREHLQALRTYQQAIKIAPRDFRPFYQAANVLRDSKDYVGAEAMLRRAAELAPGDLNIRRQLGAVIALNLVHNSQEANAAL